MFRAIAEELAKERGKLPEGSDKSDHDLAHMKRICASYSGKQVYIQSQSNPLLYNLKQILSYTYKKSLQLSHVSLVERPIDLIKPSEITIFNIYLVVDTTQLVAQSRALLNSLASMIYKGNFASQNIV